MCRRDRVRELEATRLKLDRSATKYQLLYKAHPEPIWVFDVEALAFLEVNDPEMIPHVVVVSSARPQDLERVRQRYPDTPVLRKPFDLKDLTVDELTARLHRLARRTAGPYVRLVASSGRHSHVKAPLRQI